MTWATLSVIVKARPKTFVCQEPTSLISCLLQGDKRNSENLNLALLCLPKASMLKRGVGGPWSASCQKEVAVTPSVKQFALDWQTS